MSKEEVEAAFDGAAERVEARHREVVAALKSAVEKAKSSALSKVSPG
jgi:hypothetical protein